MNRLKFFGCLTPGDADNSLDMQKESIQECADQLGGEVVMFVNAGEGKAAIEMLERGELDAMILFTPEQIAVVYR